MHYQSLIIKINTRSVKQSKIITQQPKTIENSNIVIIINSVIIEHPKNSHKLSQTIRQAEKHSQIALYVVIKKSENFWNKKTLKITKSAHVLKDMQVLIMLKL